MPGSIGQSCGGPDKRGGAYRKEQVTAAHGRCRFVHCRFRDRLAEPHHTGTKHATTTWTDRHFERHICIINKAAFDETTIREKIAVEFDDVAAACTLMQAVDILRNDGQGRYQTGKPDERMVARIRFDACNDIVPPAVPAPDQRRVALKRLRGGQLVRIVLFP